MIPSEVTEKHKARNLQAVADTTTIWSMLESTFRAAIAAVVVVEPTWDTIACVIEIAGVREESGVRSIVAAIMQWPCSSFQLVGGIS